MKSIFIARKKGGQGFSVFYTKVSYVQGINSRFTDSTVFC